MGSRRLAASLPFFFCGVRRGGVWRVRRELRMLPTQVGLFTIAHTSAGSHVEPTPRKCRDTQRHARMQARTHLLAPAARGHALAVHEQVAVRLLGRDAVQLRELLLLEVVLLRVGADLDEGAGLDHLGDLLPVLPVQLQALQEEQVLLVRPPACVCVGTRDAGEPSCLHAPLGCPPPSGGRGAFPVSPEPVGRQVAERLPDCARSLGVPVTRRPDVGMGAGAV